MTQEQTSLRDRDRIVSAIRQQLARTPEAPDSDIIIALKEEGIHALPALIRETREERAMLRKKAGSG